MGGTGGLIGFDSEGKVNVEFNSNGLSKKFTVIEVSGLDRAGLLYGLTRELADLNLSIGSAHVGTYGEKAVDVFYVTDLTGAKIKNTARQNRIRDRLIKILEPRAEKTSNKTGPA